MRPDATIAVDLVLLEQERDAVDIGFHRIGLVLHHRGQIELRRVDNDAERREPMRCLREHMRGVQQRLGGNAADIEAGAAVGCVLLDDGRLEAQLRRADRADIAAGSRADDDKIVSHFTSNKQG